MTDLKDFELPNILSNWNGEVSESIKNNIDALLKYNADFYKNVPIGFIRMGLTGGNFSIEKHVGSGNYIELFNTSSLKDLIIKANKEYSSILTPELVPEKKSDFGHWIQECCNKNAIATTRSSDSERDTIRLNVIKPGFAKVIIVSPGGENYTARTGVDSKELDENKYSSVAVKGSAFKSILNAANVDENFSFKVSCGIHGYPGAPTLDAVSCNLYKQIPCFLYRGGGKKNAIFFDDVVSNVVNEDGTDSGLIRLSVAGGCYTIGGIMSKPFGQSQNIFQRIRYNCKGRGLDYVYELYKDLQSPSGDQVSEEEAIALYTNYIGYGAGAPSIPKNNINFAHSVSFSEKPLVISSGGCGGGMLELFVYLDVGQIEIYIPKPSSGIYNYNKGKIIYGKTYNPFVHGGLPGGRGIVVIEPLLSIK